MSFRHFAPLLTLALMAWSSVGITEPDKSGYDPEPTDLYSSPPNGSIAIPSGDINIVPGVTDFNKALSDKAAEVKDTENFLGCGGVGQGEYTTGLYNMPEAFGKFEQDAQSMLAKQLVSLNFVMPQTAALFDQLNNYGNQRYQIFQKSCNLDTLRQEAKNQYLKACVEKIKDDRAGIIKKALNGTDVSKKDEFINPAAYAQAFEVCENQYVSDTSLITMRNDTLKTFAEKIREVENVTKAISPLLCDDSSKTKGKKTCWQGLLIPQARLCLEGSLGCTDTSGYKVADPLLPMPRLFDTFRYIMDDVVVARRVNNLHRQITMAGIQSSAITEAGEDAALVISAATWARSTDGGIEATVAGTPSFGYARKSTDGVDETVEAFQLNYLACKDADILSSIKAYQTKLNYLTAVETDHSDSKFSIPELTATDYRTVIDRLGINDDEAEQTTGLNSMAWVALGCTANQSIPIFDPNLFASLNTQCEQQDRYAFYSMASYDVSLQATQSVYRFLALRLKQVYAQLLTDATVPGSDAKDPVISKEINARLAQVVKEAMIPQVEAQIERLNGLTQTRGAFAQRVQQIYTQKKGCMTSSGWSN